MDEVGVIHAVLEIGRLKRKRWQSSSDAPCAFCFEQAEAFGDCVLAKYICCTEDLPIEATFRRIQG